MEHVRHRHETLVARSDGRERDATGAFRHGRRRSDARWTPWKAVDSR